VTRAQLILTILGAGALGGVIAGAMIGGWPEWLSLGPSRSDEQARCERSLGSRGAYYTLTRAPVFERDHWPHFLTLYTDVGVATCRFERDGTLIFNLS